MKVTDFSKTLTDFLSSYLPLQRNVSRNTISSYCDTFSLFLRYCRDERNLPIERLTLKNIDENIIRGFLTWIEEIRGNSISTRNQRLAAIHSFFRYVQVEYPINLAQYQKIMAIPLKKKEKPTISYLSADDVKLILQQINLLTPSGRRDLAMLSVLYDTGARVQEIADALVRDVRLEHPARICLRGKGRKMREIPLMTKTVGVLNIYFADQRLDSPSKLDCPLFFNRQHNKLTRAGISYILDKYVRLAKVFSQSIPDAVTPHVLRHTKAMHLLQGGINIIYIRDILGHVDVSTTEIYARADTEMKRQALERLNTDTIPSSAPSWADDTDLISWLKAYGRAD